MSYFDSFPLGFSGNSFSSSFKKNLQKILQTEYVCSFGSSSAISTDGNPIWRFSEDSFRSSFEKLFIFLSINVHSDFIFREIPFGAPTLFQNSFEQFLGHPLRIPYNEPSGISFAVFWKLLPEFLNDSFSEFERRFSIGFKNSF